MNTAVLTSIYSEFWGTKHFKKSCERLGLPIFNAFVGNQFTGNGDANNMLYKKLLELKSQYDYTIYADGADSLFIKPFKVPKNYIFYSTEKAIWPTTPKMQEAWKDYYGNIDYGIIKEFNDPLTYKYSKSPWKYLNAGGWCGPTELLIEFFEKYGLANLKGDVNGQDYHALAFLQAFKEDFPIYLDTQCTIFQTTGFTHEGDFYADEAVFKNLINETEPCILHGNGRTDMSALYKLYNK